MIYLVTRQTQLFESIGYKIISVEESLKMLMSWNRIQFDSETTGRDAHINKTLCIQFGNKKAGHQIVVDTTTIDILVYKEVLETKPLIGQNLKFDLQFLYSCGIVPLMVYDTMIVEQLLYLGYPSGSVRMSLHAIADRYLGINIDKTVRGEIIWRGLDTSVIIYAAGDVTYLEDIMELQLRACTEKDCLIGARLECDFVPVIAYLEWCGIRLDVDKWKEKMFKQEIALTHCKEALDSFVTNHYKEYNGEDFYVTRAFKLTEKHLIPRNAIPVGEVYYEEYSNIPIKKFKIPYKFVHIERQGDLFSGFNTEPQCLINWSSSKQVIEYVNYLGFNTNIQDKKTGEDKDSVVEKHLKGQKGINDEFLKLYFAYQEASKVCSTYGQSYIDAINPKTGRIHTIFRQLGASSGRMSCGAGNQKNTDLAKLKGIAPKLCGYVQLQNLPSDEETRSSFIPNKDNLMCSCDYSALESRLGADIYEEEAMIHEFLYGSGDMHSLVAKACFPEELEGIEIKDIKKQRPDLRNKAKAPEFACQFGGGAMSIKDSLSCSMEEAQAIEDGYFTLFSGIKKFKEEGAKFVKNNGYILICKYTGHKMYWHDWEDWVARGKTFTSEFWDRYRGVKEDYTKKIKAWEDGGKKTRMPEKPEVMQLVSMHFKAGAKYERLALNSPAQGTGIILLKDAMVNFFHWIVKNGHFNKILICNLVHDEAVIEYPKTLKDIDKILSKYMEASAAKYCKALPIPAVGEVGNCWIH